MPIGRREFLALAASGAALALGEDSPKLPRRTGMGIGSSSYAIRSRAEKGFTDPLKFLEFCHERGAGGVQVPIGARDAEYAKRLRQRVEELGMYLEGSLRTPRDESDVGRFEGEVRTARGAGASVVRTVMLSGRRYETFKSSDEFRAFHKSSLSSLQLAEPVLARHKMKLAVENHKDYRTDQLADLMRRMDSEFIGVCVDTGNNIALLDDALETAKTLAPWAYSCHLKDMAAEEYADGFLLSEVPLGEGSLDLKQIVAVLRKARPEVRFSLEMITRDPLKIPCLTDGYWATMADVPGRDLARTLAWVRRHARKEPLPRIGPLGRAEQIAAEEENVRRSLRCAREELGL